MVSELIVQHASDLGIDLRSLKRLWLHQANINMNEMIGRKVLGRDPVPGENVIILDTQYELGWSRLPVCAAPPFARPAPCGGHP